MASFHNSDEVQNQAYNQTIHGNISYHNTYVNADKRRRHDGDAMGVGIEKTLDDDILSSLAFPQMFDRRSNVETAHKQTCQWIFSHEAYQGWKSKSAGLLWIKGKPGAGKSTLISHLHSALCLEPVNTRGILLEFFFSARGTELQRTLRGMLRSLLNQIFKHDPSIRGIVRKPYLEKHASFGSSEHRWEWQVPELQTLLTRVILASAERQQLVLLIDALDEAGEPAAREAASYFHSINDRAAQSTAKTRICISCRHYPIPSSIKATEITVEDHNQSDIVAYIRDHINVDELSPDNFGEKTQWMQFIEDLTNLAHGVFQWVRIVVPMIEKFISDGDPPHGIRQWLSRVPEELGEVYKHIIEKVIDPKNRVMSFRLFQWVFLAERPLSISELRYALATYDINAESPQVRCSETRNFVKSDQAMRLRVKSCSGGLLEVVGGGGNQQQIVRVVHQSVNDFLAKQGLHILIKFSHSELGPSSANIACGDASEMTASCHANIYWLCLNFLSVDALAAAVEQGLKKPDSEGQFVDDDAKGMSSSKMVEGLPFLKYVACFMPLHAQKARSYRDRGLKAEMQLLSSVIPCWIAAQLQIRGPKLHVDFPQFHRGATVLHVAAASGLEDLTAYILAQQVGVNEVDTRGETPLHVAVCSGYLPTTTLLVRAGADVNKVSPCTGAPLMRSAIHGNLALFSWLLDQGATLDVTDRDGATTLYYAVTGKNIAIVKLCIQKGSDVNARQGRFVSALQAASENGDKDIVRLLLDAGADVNARGGYHETALQAASAFGKESIVRLLLDAGADVNARGGYYETALQAASVCGRVSTVRALLEAGADVNAEVVKYRSALQAASVFGNEIIVRILVDAGADVNAEGGIYGTAIQAASRVSEGVVRILLDTGANVNARGGYHETALQAASAFGKESIVRLLLDVGADVNARGGYYGSALQAASRRGYSGIFKLLRDAGAKSDTEQT